MIRYCFLLAAFICCAAAGAAEPPGFATPPAATRAGEKPAAGEKILCSFELEEMKRSYPGFQVKDAAGSMIFRDLGRGVDAFELSKEHATDGAWSMVRNGRDPYSDAEISAMFNSYFFGMNWIRHIGAGDWRGYAQLRLDVAVSDAEGVLRLLFEDDAVLSPYLRYKVPAGRIVTIVAPLKRAVEAAKAAENGELDLGKVHSLYLWVESAPKSRVFVDNLRLAGEGAPPPAVAVEPFQMLGADFGWSEQVKNLPPIPKREFPRASGPVEQLGPVTLPKAGYTDKSYISGGIFGKGGDYGTAIIRGVAAYDNRRILVILDPGRAFASFDGGATWGGLDGKSPGPTITGAWSGHSGVGGSHYTGDAYSMIRCSPMTKRDGNGAITFDGELYPHRCHGGGNIGYAGMKIIIFQGDRWELGPEVLLDHHMRHCPGVPGAVFLQLKSGRTWGFWHSDCNLQGGIHIVGKCSDDGGLTWKFPGRHPSIFGLNKAHINGFLPFPYKEHVAVVWNPRDDSGGTPVAWCWFDGEKFSEPQVIDKAALMASAAAIPDGTVFVAMKPRRNGRGLFVKRLAGAEWKADPLDDGAAGAIGSVALTASGDEAFCFWMREEAKGEAKSYPLLYSSWSRDGGWSQPVEIARESEPVHRIVTPEVCPPDYVPVFWDNGIRDNKPGWSDKLWVRFARVPADKPWKPKAP
ncbi:MAG: hypothetical protein V2A79_11035 [Planctomycetota bacterium]